MKRLTNLARLRAYACGTSSSGADELTSAVGPCVGTRGTSTPLPECSLWQPILKRKKRCMQRMDRGKPKSDLALRSAGLANQFLYVHMRESRVGQVLG